MSRVAKRLYATDETFREVADLLFGGGADELVSKLSPKKEEAKRQKRQAQVGLASNVVGITAGTAGLSAALKDERLNQGGKVGQKLYRIGTGMENAANKTKIGGKYYKWVAKPGVAPKLAAGAVGLQTANLAGDAVANRVLSRESKKKVSKRGGRLVPISKAEPGSSDVHSLSAGKLKRIATQKVLNETPEVGGKVKQFVRGKKKAEVTKSITWEGEISKVDADKRQVFGWASIVEMNGQPVVDLQGDYIDIDEIEKSAYDYVVKSRKGGNMHLRNGTEPVHVSDMIESFLVTPEKKEKMGLPESVPTGWWVGYQINDDEAWNLVKSGKRTGFSIHGRGQRTPTVI